MFPYGTSSMPVPGQATTPETANAMLCQRVVPSYTLADIDTLDFVVTSLHSGSFCGMAIYADGGGTRLATTDAVSTTANGIKSTAVTPFTLSEGTTYLYCWGCSTTNPALKGTADFSITGTTSDDDFLNAGVYTWGYVASSMTAGAPNSTVGALTTPPSTAGMAWMKARKE